MLKILIVDKDRYFLQTLRHILESQRYKVFTIPGGNYLLSALLSFRPDLILMDKLEEEEGLSLCKMVKTGPFRDIPVFIMSELNELKNKAFRAKADEFLEKPFSLRILLSKIYKVAGVLFN